MKTKRIEKKTVFIYRAANKLSLFADTVPTDPTFTSLTTTVTGMPPIR